MVVERLGVASLGESEGFTSMKPAPITSAPPNSAAAPTTTIRTRLTRPSRRLEVEHMNTIS